VLCATASSYSSLIIAGFKNKKIKKIKKKRLMAVQSKTQLSILNKQQHIEKKNLFSFLIDLKVNK